MTDILISNDTYLCAQDYDVSLFGDAITPIAFFICLAIIAATVFSNSMVLAASTVSEKLRSVSNQFILSLAVSDLLVGVVVLPFAASWNIYKVWVFGEYACSIWLCLDTWLRTTSIFNLCVISVDRYLAVTRPMNYPTVMSPKRAKLIIAGVWMLSLVMSLAPLIFMKDLRLDYDPRLEYVNVRALGSLIIPAFYDGNYYNYTDLTEFIDQTKQVKRAVVREMYEQKFEIRVHHRELGRLGGKAVVGAIEEYLNIMKNAGENVTEYLNIAMNNVTVTPQASGSGTLNGNYICSQSCEISNKATLVLYVALGSLVVPLFVVLLYYCGIFSAARDTRVAIKKGYRTTKGDQDGEALTLRIHRGRPKPKDDQRGERRQTSSTKTSEPKTPIKTRSTNIHDPFRAQPVTSESGLRRRTAFDEPIPSTSDGRTGQLSTIVEIEPETASQTNSVQKLPSPSKSASPPHIRKRTVYRPKEHGHSVYYSKKGRKSDDEPTCTIEISASETSAESTPQHSKTEPGSSSQEQEIYHSGETSIESTPQHSKTEPGSSSQEQEIYHSGETSIESTPQHSKIEPGTSRRARNISQSGETSTATDTVPGSPTESQKSKSESRCERCMNRLKKSKIVKCGKRLKIKSKAARTLSLVLGVFIACWTPFFFGLVLRAICITCISSTTFRILLWIAYLSAAINPCIYAFYSKDYRDAFRKITNKCIRRQRPQDILDIDRGRQKGFVTRVREWYRSRMDSTTPENADRPVEEAIELV